MSPTYTRSSWMYLYCYYGVRVYMLRCTRYGTCDESAAADPIWDVREIPRARSVMLKSLLCIILFAVNTLIATTTDYVRVDTVTEIISYITVTSLQHFSLTWKTSTSAFHAANQRLLCNRIIRKNTSDPLCLLRYVISPGRRLNILIHKQYIMSYRWPTVVRNGNRHYNRTLQSVYMYIILYYTFIRKPPKNTSERLINYFYSCGHGGHLPATNDVRVFCDKEQR